MKITYVGNTEESYTILLDGKEQVKVSLGEDSVIELVNQIRTDLSNKQYDNGKHTIDIKKLADCIVIDVYDSELKFQDEFHYFFCDYIS